MWTWRFWRETLERAIKTAAEAPVLYLGIGAGWSIANIDWMVFGQYAAGGAIVSVLFSLLSLKPGADNSPSAIE